MRILCRTLFCKTMKYNKIRITIRISKECFEAYKFLQSKKINPAKYMREGGEKKVIEMAQKNKFTIKKIKLPF